MGDVLMGRVNLRALIAGVVLSASLALAPSALAISWAGPVTVSTSGEMAYPFSRSVAVDAVGDMIVAWNRVSDASGGSWHCPCTVRAAYKPAGGSFGAPVDVSPTIANPDSGESSVYVAMSAAGEAIVAYTAPANPSDATEPSDTVYAAIQPVGGSFGAPAVIDPARGSSGALLDGLAMDAAGDAVALVTNSQPYTGAGATAGDETFDAEVVRRTAGGLFDSAHPQILTDGSHTGYGRAIAMSPNGKAVVGIRSDVDDESHPTAPEPNSVQVAVSTAPGAPFGTPATLETVTPSTFAGNPSVDVSEHQVAIDDAGEYAIEYGHADSVSSTKVRVSLNGGAPVDLNTGSATSPAQVALLMNPSGEALAFWDDTNGNWFMNIRSAGQGFGPPVGTPPLGAAPKAKNVEGGNGDVLDAFDAFDGSGNTTVDASLRPAGGSFSAPQALSPVNDDPFAFGEDAAIDENDDALVAWTDVNFAVRVATTGASAGGGGGGGGTGGTGGTGTGGTGTGTGGTGTTGTAPPPTRPNTTLAGHQVNRELRQARFTFKAVGQASGFKCALVKHTKKRKHHKQPKPRYSRCSSPKVYRHLARGKYTFYVRAFNAAGVDLTPTTFGFKI
jgi:hypothetical protein